jgi:energy-converting hydrogenase B subunit D
MTLLDVIMLILSLLLLVMAFLAVSSKHTMKSVVFLSVLSMLSVVGFILLQAPDVAITEAVVGSGLVTALFIFSLLSMKQKGEKQ